MLETDDLIRQLAMEVRPVRRLAAPSIRTAHWFALTLPAVAAIVMLMSPREDLAQKVVELRFLVEQAAALATALTAAYAAFCLTVPGHNRIVMLIPGIPLALWLGSLGQGCVQDRLLYGKDAFLLYPDWVCFPAIVLVGSVPAIAMMMMLRRGAALAPGITMGLGALAAAALGNFGLRLFHYQDASLMVLVWQFGSVALLSALAGSAGSRVLTWAHSRRSL